MTNVHIRPGSSANDWKVLVKPFGPHHRARRASSANAAKMLDGDAAISRDACNLMAGTVLP
ncbi:Uncharacterised protein [Mycobacteroides abscessus]|nr:Uncharacterised protein [Mycobacteroides abscessus]